MGFGARVAAVAAAAALAAALAAVGPPGRRIEREIGQWLLVRLRGPVPVPEGAVIVAQDYASAEALGLGHTLAGWPRRHLARVIERASAAGARAVVLDLVFERAQAREDDEALERAVAASGRVLLVEGMRRESGDAGGLGTIRETVKAPPWPLAAAAVATAPFPLPRPEEGARVAGFWTFKSGAGGRPTLPAAVLLSEALADPAALAAAVGDEAGLAAAGRDARGPAETPLAQRFAALRRALLADPDAAARARARAAAASPLAAAAVDLLAGGEERLLVPYGPAGHVPWVSYHRVLEGDPAALAALGGRVVLIGASDLREQVQKDAFRTVFRRPDGIELAGVEVAATAYLNLLHGDAARPASWEATLLLAGGTAAGAAAAGALAPPLLAAGVVVATGAGITAAGVGLLRARAVALPVGSVLLMSLPLGLLAGLLARHAAVRGQLDRSVGILTRGRARRAGGPLRGLERAAPREERWAVCLATDLADYVRLTEAMAAREADLADLVADYWAALHGVVERFGGTVLDTAGDASMSVWDAPGPDPALRARAVRGALELARELDRFAAARGLQGHATRIGLAEGRVVLGNIAAGGRFAFGAVGEPLNVAARLEQLNKLTGTRVLATAAVAGAVPGVAARALGPVLLKGRSRAEDVVALDAAIADDSGLAA